MALGQAFPLSSTSVVCSTRNGIKTPVKNRGNASVGSAFGNIKDVVKKDFGFMKKGFDRGVEWANKNLRVPEVVKSVDDFIWLRYLENPHVNFPNRAPTLPQPYYPGLSGVDLLLADLNALEMYASYMYYYLKIFRKPLPEVYDPEEVACYFNLRPHVVALRVLEVFAAFASAAFRSRVSGFHSVIGNVDKDISQYNFGMLLKETMLNLGPTFIKIGQSLSTRPDIIGSEISKALSGLHDQIPPFPRVAALKIIEEEFDSPVERVFSYLSEEPVAAASFGQVYRGATLDGLDVAVKVQRPNLRHVVVRDIYILRLGLGLLQKVAKRRSNLRLYADELGKGFVGELDYTMEAANAEEFMEKHARYPFIRVPKVFRHLSRKRVLTMEWMVGESPRDLLFLASESADQDSVHHEKRQMEARKRLLDLVSRGVEASLIQLLETGLLHADPHPGNLRYISPRQIGFLDFGLVCRMEKKHQFAMLASILHIVYGDWASLVNALADMDVARPGTNLRRVINDLEDALGEVEFQNGIPNVKFSRVLGKIWSVALKYHFRMPPYYTLVLRSLASLEGLAVAADPNFRTFEAAYPYVVRKLLTDNSAPSRRILHSVILNRRKELQWQKLAIFLKVGAARKGLQLLAASNSQESPDHSSSDADGVVKLMLTLLPSKDGRVLRRLLMTVDGSSLVQALVSREAAVYRQQFCKVIADCVYRWMGKVLGKGNEIKSFGSPVLYPSALENELDSSSRLPKLEEYQSLLRDRRIKLILLKALDSTRKQPSLILRFCWASLVMLVTASVLAFHRMIVTLVEDSVVHLSSARKQIAFGA